MPEANPLWGAPRIHGEVLNLGLDVSQATVAKSIVRHWRPPSQTWRTFLGNHVDQIVAADFFVVPTMTYRLLFVLVTWPINVAALSTSRWSSAYHAEGDRSGRLR
jgi:putative transposase